MRAAHFVIRPVRAPVCNRDVQRTCTLRNATYPLRHALDWSDAAAGMDLESGMYVVAHHRRRPGPRPDKSGLDES